MESKIKAEDVVIAGAGPIGLACAVSAVRRGLDPLVIDAGPVAGSIVRYPIGMRFFTTPERLEIGGHPLVCAGPKPTREEALKYYRGVARTEGLRVRTYTRLESAASRGSHIECAVRTRLGEEVLACRRLVLATGYFEQPNALGVPGEDLPHVSHYYDEAHLSYGLDVAVIGGKNSAVEAALELYRAGARVTVVYRKPEFSRSVKYWLRPDIENRIAAREVTAHLGAEVLEITEREVAVRTASGSEVRVPAARIYALTGFQPDFGLFRRIGIELDPSSGRPSLDPDTLETNVPGIYMAGSITAGRAISEVFIENGRYDGEKVFGDAAERAEAARRYASSTRPQGE
jgi:thioredoxin reductase (NADPH)